LKGTGVKFKEQCQSYVISNKKKGCILNLFYRKLIGGPVGIREFPDTIVLIMQLQQHFLGKMF